MAVTVPSRPIVLAPVGGPDGALVEAVCEPAVAEVVAEVEGVIVMAGA